MAEIQITPTAKPVVATRAPDASKGMTLFVMIVATLYFGKEVLVPVTLALLLAFILAPLVHLLGRAYLGRVPSVLLAVLLALGVISAVGGVIGSQIGDLSTELPTYVATAQTKIADVKRSTVDELAKLANRAGVHGNGAAALSLALPTLQTPSSQPQSSAPAARGAAPQGSSPLDLAQRYLSPILTPLANLGIVFIVAVFALLQREDLRDRLIRLIGASDLHRTTLAIDEAARRLSRYFIVQLSINTLFGVAIGTGLLLIGVPNPILWGILSGLLRFVPYVGSLISAILPLMLAAAAEPGWSMTLSTAILFVAAEGATGQIIEPLVYGHSTGLSPFSVVVAAIFWSWLWGPIGLILSTPLTLCLVVMGRHAKRLEFLDIMLGDQSPLTPVESFYQRLLAGDADELQDQAERLLKERSLSTYYDEVAMKGLQMASHDTQRGAVDGEQSEKIKNTVRHLIRGLEKHNDKQPPQPAKPDDNGPVDEMNSGKIIPRNPDPQSVAVPHDTPPNIWESPSAVLSIAGRDPLDELAASMLSQLIAKHGLSSRAVSYNDVSREQIDGLDVTGVAMVCISLLNIVGSPAHLRYLVQRLKQKLPQGTPILIGVWPLSDPTLNEEGTKTAIGADYYTHSLEQAVTICAQTAQRATS